jgi:hypothetical protein
MHKATPIFHTYTGVFMRTLDKLMGRSSNTVETNSAGGASAPEKPSKASRLANAAKGALHGLQRNSRSTATHEVPPSEQRRAAAPLQSSRSPGALDSFGPPSLYTNPIIKYLAGKRDQAAKTGSDYTSASIGDLVSLYSGSRGILSQADEGFINQQLQELPILDTHDLVSLYSDKLSAGDKKSIDLKMKHIDVLAGQLGEMESKDTDILDSIAFLNKEIRMILSSVAAQKD